MGTTTWPVLVLALVAAITPAAHVYAQQEPARHLDRPALSLGQVYVEEDSGIETRGRVIRFDASMIEVRAADGEVRRFDMDHVRRISTRGDSLKNGATIGAAVGFVMGVLAAGFSDGCNGTGQQLTMVALGTVTYASIGTALDATIQGRTVIYQRGAPRR
jgi:hypothetical protein